MIPLHDTWRSSINMHVPTAQYSSEVNQNTGEYRVDMGALAAADADGLLAAQAMTSATSTTTFAAAYTVAKMGPYGRNITGVGPANTTNVVTIHGKDYLGQPMTEQITLNSATPVAGVKAFKEVTEIEWTSDADASAVNIGWGDVFGLPFRTVALQNSIENGVSATAATLVAGALTATTQTATTADPRGTLDFNGTPDASRTFSAICVADLDNLYGNAHFYSG